MIAYLAYVISPFVVAAFSFLFNPKGPNSSYRSKRNYMIFMGIIIVLMVGLRNSKNGSGDSLYYYNHWEYFSTLSLRGFINALSNIDIEYGYQFTVWILAHIFKSGQFVFVFSGAFFAFAICKFILKNCKDVMLPLVIFNSLGLFNFMVQGLRQGIAMCICLFAIENCKKNQFWRFCLLIIVASLYHASAAVFIAVYPISKIKLNFRGLLLYSVSVISCYLLMPTLFRILNRIMNDGYTVHEAEVTGGKVAILIHLSVILFGLMLYQRNRRDNDYAFVFYLSCTALFALIMRNTIAGIAERASHYYAFGQMVMVSNCQNNIKDPNLRAIVKLIICLLCFGVALYKASYSVLIPYRFFWQT